MSLQVSNAFKGMASLYGDAIAPLIGGSTAGIDRHSSCLNTIISQYMYASLTNNTYTANTGHRLSDFNNILLANGNGYTRQTAITATPPILSFDPVSGYVTATLPTVSWTATGGSIGPARGMFISGPIWLGAPTTNTDLIYFWVDFGTAITQTDGGVLSVTPQIILG